MSVKDLAAISFQAMPQGKAEGGKLQTEQLKHYYLSIISRIDEMQEFHDYAEGLQWFMETNPDPEVAVRFLKERCSCDPGPSEEWVMQDTRDGAMHQYPITPGRCHPTQDSIFRG